MYDSHAKMDDVEENSNSDEELDSQELEVALYSQIHFDSGTQAEQWLDSNHYSYSRSTHLRIGVKELPIRTRSNLKQPVFDGEFIAFSKSKSDDEGGGVGMEPCNLASSQQGKNKIVEFDTPVVELGNEKSKGGGVKKQLVVSSSASDKVKSSSVVRCHKAGSSSAESNKNTDSLEKSQVKSPILEYKIDSKKYALDSVPKDRTDVNKSHSDGGTHNKFIKQETGKSAPKVKNLKTGDAVELKETALCLPFSLTKASKKKNVTETSTEWGSTDKETVVTQLVTLGKRKATNNHAKLESFMELPTSGIGSLIKQKKRASLSKTDAAVKPRTPQFFLRRPPATVVKYRQDSDTNTDYSDSEPSIGGSPVKGKQNTSKDATLHKNSVIEAAKPRNTNTKHKGAAAAEDKSDVCILAEHQGGRLDEVVSNRSESATTSSHGVSMSSEVETDEDPGDGNELQVALGVDDGSGDGISSSQEESTSDSEDTDSSESEEFIAENIPGLEFNLDRGIAGFAVENPDNWKINEKDRLSINPTLSRYFFPRSIQCRNCKVDGHLSRDCPKPLKRRCIFCGMAGHSYQACPSAICYNCSAPGHRVNECKEQKIKWTTMCDRCWMSGHEEKKCPDRWRQYHITVSPKGSHLAAATKDVWNPLVFCYNCGKKGHLGFECKMPRMNKFTTAPYPFVACYDGKNQSKEMRRGRAGISDCSETASLTDNKSKKQRFKEMKKKGFDRDKHCRLKGQKGRKHVQDSEDEYTHPTKKRRRSNQKRADEHWDNFKTGGSSSERNQFIGQGRKTAFVRDQRSRMATFRRQEVANEGVIDEILNDFGKHQVNNNEWWNRSGKPEKKKRKRHSNIFELDCFHDDWQRNRPEDREKLTDKDMSSFQGGQVQRFNAKGYDKHWKKNKPPQKGPAQSRHRDFKPEFQFNHGDFIPEFQFNQQTYENNRTSNYRDHAVGGFSSDKHNQEYRASFSNKNSKKTKRQKADFQNLGSDFSPHPVGGFQVHNDRFVAMKRNHNITVSFRK